MNKAADSMSEQPAVLAARMTAFVAAFGVLATIGMLAFHGTRMGSSTGIGAIVALANFLILRVIVLRVTSGDVHTKGPFLAALFFKMGAVMFLVYFVLAHHWVDPIAFIVGLSALVVGLITSSFFLMGSRNAAR